MGVNVFRGDSRDVAQVWSWSVTTDDATSTYNLIINGKTIGQVGTGTGDSATAAAIVANLQTYQSTINELSEITFANPSGANITATAAKAGIPFSFTLSVVGGTGAFSAITVTTPSSGHYHADDASNWTLGWTPQGACSAPVQANISVTSGGSLTDGTTYYYEITATNNNGETTVSNEKNTGSISGSNQTAVLSWAQVTNATGYNIYRGTSASGENKLIATITSGSTLTFNDTGIAGSTATPPVSNTAVADTIYFTNSANNCLYGINNLSTVTPITLYIDASYTGQIGLPTYNALGYREYRPQYLQFLGAGAVVIGDGAGSASGFLKLDFQSGAVPITVLGLGPPTQQAFGSSASLPALILNGSNASNTLTIMQGSCGLALDPGATAQFPTINVGYEKNIATDVTLYLGRGFATGATINQNGGNLTSEVSVTTLNMTAGSFTLLNAATMGTVTCNGGTYYWQSSGTMTSGTFYGTAAKLDCSQVPTARAATSLSVKGGATLNDPYKSITALAYATDSQSLAKANLGNSPFTVTRS